ncbi:hypothetical protein GQ53DRAFT_362990 [Thozetella sp. PMI_491]|nr:hypothetical protein GQ53DRAFT_362990 [Thozetella sp. PMI_491]
MAVRPPFRIGARSQPCPSSGWDERRQEKRGVYVPSPGPASLCACGSYCKKARKGMMSARLAPRDERAVSDPSQPVASPRGRDAAIDPLRLCLVYTYSTQMSPA